MTRLAVQNQHFNAYYHDNALLIQFVVTEFVQIAFLAEQLKSLTDECLESKEKLEKALSPLFHSLNSLVGTISDQEPLSFSHWTRGPLTKLKEYCEQLYRNTPSQNDITEMLHVHVYKSWVGALYSLELLNTIQLGMNNASVKLSTIKKGFSSLHTSLNGITKMIPRLINDYVHHENVLFFLHRKKNHLVQIYGTSFVNKLLQLRSNADQKSQLIQNLREKGFENILSLISEDK